MLQKVVEKSISEHFIRPCSYRVWAPNKWSKSPCRNTLFGPGVSMAKRLPASVGFIHKLFWKSASENLLPRGPPRQPLSFLGGAKNPPRIGCAKNPHPKTRGKATLPQTRGKKVHVLTLSRVGSKTWSKSPYPSTSFGLALIAFGLQTMVQSPCPTASFGPALIVSRHAPPCLDTCNRLSARETVSRHVRGHAQPSVHSQVHNVLIAPELQLPWKWEFS